MNQTATRSRSRLAFITITPPISSHINTEFEPTKEDLQQLREWLQKMPHLIHDYDDEFLAALVRGSKGSLNKTKFLLEKGNALGMNYPHLFGTYDPLYPPLQEHLSVWLTFPLPQKTPEGHTVIFTSLNPKSNEPSKSHLAEHCRYALFTTCVLIWENDFGSGQWRLIYDTKGVGLAHVKDLTPTIVKQQIEIQETCAPIRIHSLTIFNMPTYLEYLCNIFKSACNKKLADRLFFYDNMDKITENIPQKMLPKEYGGCEKSVFVLHDNWKKKVESYRQRFLEEERKMRELDPLRPRTDEEDDMIGTFRQLKVD